MMMNFLEQFPDKASLLNRFRDPFAASPLKVNNHIHSPYSFSAFDSIREAVLLAAGEDVRVLGINDFYVTDGYAEFIEACIGQGIFPLLNIEMIGISGGEQKAGIRVNDPNNPGRTYISGKGLSFPVEMPPRAEARRSALIKEGNRQVTAMVDLLNEWLTRQETGIRISVEEIMETLARRLLRERHVARMLRLKLEKASLPDGEFEALLLKVYGGNPTTRKRSDIAGLEEELRARLLKAGAPAFVPEDSRAFLPVDEIVRWIRVAGGIPTYPLLLDGAGNAVTEFEDGKEQLLETLDRWGFQSVEFIPLRNRIGKLKEYAEFFYENGFVVSFGTEHNTSAMLPITVSCKDGVALDHSLAAISFNGAAYIAAHQYLVEKEGPGYPHYSREEMEQLGKAVFRYYFKNVTSAFAKNQSPTPWNQTGNRS